MKRTYRLRRLILVALLFLVLGYGPLVGEAGQGKNKSAPNAAPKPVRPGPDSAILEVDLPPRATLTIDGNVPEERNRPEGGQKSKGRPVFRGLLILEEEIGSAISRTERHRYQFRDLKKGRLYKHEVEVRLGKAEPVQRRQIFVRAGEVTHWAPRGPGQPLPEILLQKGHTFSVLSVAFSPHGKYVATASADLTAILWDAQTGRQLRTLRGHGTIVSGVVFSPDGKKLATCSWDRTAILWDVQTGRKLQVYRGHTGPVRSVAFGPKGEQLITGSEDKTAILWDVATGRKLRRFQGHTGWVITVNFASAGRLLSSSGDNTVIVWNAQTGAKLHSWKTGGLLAFSSDGKQFVASPNDKKAILWDAETGRQLRSYRGSFRQPAAFSADGKRLVLTVGTGPQLYDSRTGQPLRPFKGKSLFTSGTFSPDGKRFLAGSIDGPATLWDVATAQQVQRFEGHSSSVTAVAFGTPGYRLFTVSNHTVMVWDAQAGRKQHDFQGFSIALRPDGKELFTIGAPKWTGHVWNTETGQRLRQFRWTGRGDVAQALSPDGKRLLTGSLDKNAYVWDTATGRKLDTLKGHEKDVWAVAITPDGKQFLTGSADNRAILWEARTGQQLRSFRGHTGAIHSLAFSPDGRRFLTGGYDGTAILWETQTGTRLHTFKDHASIVTSVAFSPDGTYLLTGSADKTAILWQTETGRKVRQFQGHSSFLVATAFSPDGRYVLTGAWDGTARLWDIATGDELCQLIGLDAGKDWAVVTPEGLFDGSRGGRENVFFRLGGGLDVVPLERFLQDNYYPGLLAALWRGERPRPGKPLPTSPAPLVKILVSPHADKKDHVTIDVALTDQGGGIKGPWLKHNNALIRTPAPSRRKQGKTLHQRFTLGLVPGDNRIQVGAATADGSWQSDPAVWVEHFQGSLPRPELYVLAIGINRYAKGAGVDDLHFCVADAEAIADLFRKRGGKSYRQVHVSQLHDKEATRAKILQAVAAIATKARRQDTLVLFAAGHGLTVGQRYFLVPHDFQLPEGKASARRQAIRKTGLAIDDLAEALAEVPALKRVLIFDTCQSGAVTGLAARRNPFAFRGAVERASRAQGVYCLAAATALAGAAEAKELGHGLLTYTLLAGMQATDRGSLAGKQIKAGADGVDVLEWFRFAQGEVPALSRKYVGHPQQVELSGEDQPGFPLLRAK